MNKIVSALLISALAVSFSSKPQPPYKADVYRMVSSANTGETEGEKNDGDNHPEFEPYEKIEDTYALPEGCEFTTDFIDMGDDWDDDASDDGSEEPAAKPTPEASPTPTTKPKSVFNMTKKQMNKLPVSQKAKLVGLSTSEFKLFTKLVNREAGTMMKDKIMVAAVVWNRKYCNEYPGSIKKVIRQQGQFQPKGQKTTVVIGNAKDKKAQLAILLAYKNLHQGKIAHNVKHYNSISYYSKLSRYKPYKHYNNYFQKDTQCHCKWCRR